MTRLVTDNTSQLTREAVRRAGGQRKLARTFSAEHEIYWLGRIFTAIHGRSMSLDAENELRIVLGAEPLPELRPTEVCRVHNTVHHTTCDGEDGTVAWVHPDRKIIARPGYGPRQRRRSTIQASPEVVEALRMDREAVGSPGWDDYLIYILNAAKRAR